MHIKKNTKEKKTKIITQKIFLFFEIGNVSKKKKKKKERERKLIDNESSLIECVMCIDLNNLISIKNLKTN